MQCLPELRCMFFYRNSFYDADHGRGAWSCTSGNSTDAGNQPGSPCICKRGWKTGGKTGKDGTYASFRYCDDGKLWKCNSRTCGNFRKHQLPASSSGNCTWIWYWDYRRYLWQTAQKCQISSGCTSCRTLAGRVLLLCRRCTGYHGRNQGTPPSGCNDCYRKDIRRKSGRAEAERILWEMWKMASGIQQTVSGKPHKRRYYPSVWEGDRNRWKYCHSPWKSCTGRSRDQAYGMSERDV